MKSDFLQKRVAEYVENYPGRKLYFTDDGNCFLFEADRRNHAVESGIATFDVDENGQIVGEENQNAENTPEYLAAQAKVMEMDFEKPEDLDFNELKALCKALNAKVDGKKKTDFIAALIALKVNFNELKR